MNIKHIRLVLPPRMKATAQRDARQIAESAARALAGTDSIPGALTVSVTGQHQSAPQLARQVSQAIGQQRPINKKGD